MIPSIADDYVFYLDPHTVQQVPRFPEFGDVPASEDVFDTYHCEAPLRLRLKDIDPSLCLTFYCRDRDDFDDFCARAIQVGAYPPVVIELSPTSSLITTYVS